MVTGISENPAEKLGGWGLNWRKATADYWEYFFLAAYAAIICVLVIPGLRHDYDQLHHSMLLTPSIRIWAGQIPFRDFFPWYGPLYYYLLALFTGMMGNDLHAVKIYLDLINPVACMAILILALRKLELPAGSRLFVLAAAPVLGLERIYYCGSLRTFLPALIIALWHDAFKKRSRISWGLVFPLAWLMLFFSPEIGILVLFCAFFFMVISLRLIDSRPERIQAAVWSGTGFLFCLLISAGLFFSTVWLKNYFEFFSQVTGEFSWSYGVPRFLIRYFPRAFPVFFFYLPPVVYVPFLAMVTGAALLKKGRIRGQSGLLIIALYGLLLWVSRLARGSFQFNYLPLIIMAGLAWGPPCRPIKYRKLIVQIIMVLLLIPGAKNFQPITVPFFQGQGYKILGVIVSPEKGKPIEELLEFSRNHGPDQIAFPAKSLPYTLIGRTPDLPFDDLYALTSRANRSRLFKALDTIRPRYLIFNEEDLYWDYPLEATDPLLDYIGQNYSRVGGNRPLCIFERQAQPEVLTRIIRQDTGTVRLTENNQFTMLLEPPAGTTVDYIELAVRFDYRFNFLRRMSIPVVECRLDGKRMKFFRPAVGSQRMDNTEGKNLYRLYLLDRADQIEFQITFPGAFNPEPVKVTVENIEWRQFINPEEIMPRVLGYELRPE